MVRFAVGSSTSVKWRNFERIVDYVLGAGLEPQVADSNLNCGCKRAPGSRLNSCQDTSGLTASLPTMTRDLVDKHLRTAGPRHVPTPLRPCLGVASGV